jgi:hypothetical protein
MWATIAGCAPVAAVTGDPDGDSWIDSEFRTCEDAPELTRYLAENGNLGENSWLVCDDDAGELLCGAYASDPDALLEASVGTNPDTGCSWDASFLCGPESAETPRCCYVLEVSTACAD